MSKKGQAIMCDIIFKNDLHISKIPVSWKRVIDITVVDPDDMEQFMRGGPTCTHLGKTIP
jgi:hypothetical protein